MSYSSLKQINLASTGMSPPLDGRESANLKKNFLKRSYLYRKQIR